MDGNMSGGHGGGRSGVIRETLVLMREISRGNWTRVPGSFSILIQQIGILGKLFRGVSEEQALAAIAAQKQTAATLLSAIASKVKAESALKEASAELLSEYADEAKAQAAIKEASANYLAADSALVKATAEQTEAAATLEASAASKLALTPLGWIAIAFVAVGTAAYFAISHILKLNRESKNLADLMDINTTKFSEQAAAMKKASVSAQEFNDWLQKLRDSEEGLAEQVDETLASMKEQGKFEQELAKNRGASQGQIAQMEIDQAKKQLAVVKAAQAALEVKQKADINAARKAEAQATDKGLTGNVVTAGEHSKTANSIVDEIEKELNGKKAVFDKMFYQYPGAPGVPTSRPANASDKIDVKVGDKEYSMSLDEAKANANKINAEEIRLLEVQKQLSDFAQSKKKLTEKDFQDEQKLKKEAAKITSDLLLKQKYLPLIAETEKGKMSHGNVNSLQKVGAFTDAAVDIQRRSLHHLAKIEKNTDHLGIAGHGGAVKY